MDRLDCRISSAASIRFSLISPAPGSRSSTCSIDRSAPKSPIRSAKPLNKKPRATCAGSGEERYELVANRYPVRIESRFGGDAAPALAPLLSTLDPGLDCLGCLHRLVLDRPHLRTGGARVFRALDPRLVLHP